MNEGKRRKDERLHEERIKAVQQIEKKNESKIEKRCYQMKIKWNNIKMNTACVTENEHQRERKSAYRVESNCVAENKK